jgi:hypothetical protein
MLTTTRSISVELMANPNWELIKQRELTNAVSKLISEALGDLGTDPKTMIVTVSAPSYNEQEYVVYTVTVR